VSSLIGESGIYQGGQILVAFSLIDEERFQSKGVEPTAWDATPARSAFGSIGQRPRQ
jgi:hypothetical protein